MQGEGGLPVAVRRALALAAGGVLWFDPSSGVATAILYLAGLYGLWHFRSTWACWRNPAGLLMGVGVLWAVLSLLWSFDPPSTARDLIKTAPLLFGVWAVPVLFRGRTRIWTVLTVSAALVTARLGWEMARLAAELGWPTVLTEARYTQPYLYTHPNVTSMMAGLCLLVFVARALAGAPGVWRKAGLAAGFVLNAAYLIMMASRGPQLVMALALLALPVVALPGWKARGAALLLAIGIGAGLWQGMDKINPRFRDATVGNFNRRDTIWGHAKLLADRRPALGYGYGKKVFYKAVYDNPDQRAPLVPVKYPHPHSYWLMAYFQGGRVAFAVWSLAWLALGIRLVRQAARIERNAGSWRERLRTRALPVLLLTAMASILVYGLADYPDHVLRHTLFYLVGLAMALGAPERVAAGTAR